MKSLSLLAESRDNNFQLIRFVAAIGVFVSHTFPLAGYGLGGKAQMLGHVSLNIFFIISGFLVCKSFFERPINEYFLSRALRIFPALIIVVIFSVFILGLLVTDLKPLEYLSNPIIYDYILKNILLILPNTPQNLPGVFAHAPYAPTVNAPLWSLPYEVVCYLLLAVIALLVGARNRIKLFAGLSLLLFVFCFSIYMANTITRSVDFAVFFNKDTYRLIGLFFLGVSIFIFKDRVMISHYIMLGLILVFALSLIYRPVAIVTFYLSLTYALFYFSYAIRGPILHFNSIGDYSYGIYIFGYPIQQAVEHFLPNLALVSYFTLTFGITFLLSLLSWHLIEKNALNIKKTMLINRL